MRLAINSIFARLVTGKGVSCGRSHTRQESSLKSTCLRSQVHDLHPSHAFLVVPDRPSAQDKLQRSHSDSELTTVQLERGPSDEQCKPSQSLIVAFPTVSWFSNAALRRKMCSVSLLCDRLLYIAQRFCSCMLDIVGARFHCAVCPDVDICSQCESAGLPGNLDSSDGGHSSSHIMIKVCSPTMSHTFIPLIVFIDSLSSGIL